MNTKLAAYLTFGIEKTAVTDRWITSRIARAVQNDVPLDRLARFVRNQDWRATNLFLGVPGKERALRQAQRAANAARLELAAQAPQYSRFGFKL